MLGIFHLLKIRMLFQSNLHVARIKFAFKFNPGFIPIRERKIDFGYNKPYSNLSLNNELNDTVIPLLRQGYET